MPVLALALAHTRAEAAHTPGVQRAQAPLAEQALALALRAQLVPERAPAFAPQLVQSQR